MNFLGIGFLGMGFKYHRKLGMQFKAYKVYGYGVWVIGFLGMGLQSYRFQSYKVSEKTG